MDCTIVREGKEEVSEERRDEGKQWSEEMKG